MLNPAINLPKRKHPRRDDYDYGSNGAYFITVCTQNRQCILSKIVSSGKDCLHSDPVGRGLAPAAPGEPHYKSDEKITVDYSTIGKIAEQQLLSLEQRYPSVSIDRYVIMPNHIHAIILIDNEAAGASPRPTKRNE